MDLITQLPVTPRGHNAAVVVVDKLSKMMHCFPIIAKEKGSDEANLARLFFDNVVRLHGVPKRIISDRDRRFVSNFWSELWRLLGTKLAMSTSYHPQTDGQTERMNRVLEDYIRHYISFHHHDWDLWLTGAEIAINNSVSRSTGFTPFFMNYGRNPLMPLDSVNPITANHSVATTLSNIRSNLDKAKQSIQQAQARQAAYFNRHRRDVVFQEGEEVYLSTKDLPLKHGVAKFTGRYTGPFKIIKAINDLAYKLALPGSFKNIHDVFHISKLKRHVEASEYNDRPNDSHPEPPLDDTTDDEYVVEKILAQRPSKYHPDSEYEFLVKWKDYPETESTWEPIQSFQDSNGDLTDAFKDWQRSRPTPMTSEQAISEVDRLIADLANAISPAVSKT